MVKKIMIGGDFILDDEQLDDVKCVILSVSETRAIIDELESDTPLLNALDQAQADAAYKESPQFILIKVR